MQLGFVLVVSRLGCAGSLDLVLSRSSFSPQLSSGMGRSDDKFGKSRRAYVRASASEPLRPTPLLRECDTKYACEHSWPSWPM